MAENENDNGIDDMRCDYCLLTAEHDHHERSRRPREQLLVCYCCRAKAHPSCMDYSDELAARTRLSPWQCIDCKTCSVCGDSGHANSMLFCDACDKGYHMTCHYPRITKKPHGKWICRRCVNEASKKNALYERSKHLRLIKQQTKLYNINTTTVVSPVLPPTPCHSPEPELDHTSLNSLNTMNDDDVIPDASRWSIADIENYFRSIGFPEEAKALREQEIDGPSLLLLRRKDVLTGLDLRLGPALKIFNHVERLQMKQIRKN